MNRFANIFQDRNGIREVIEELIGNEKDIYKTERKTHPSFLRGWDVSD